jgi:hypothetical protein
MIRSELASLFLRLAESAGMHPIVVVFMLLLLLLLFISAGFVLLKLRNADRVLIAVDSELDALALNFGQPSAEVNLSQNHPNKGSSGPGRGKLAENPKQDDVTQKAGTVSIVGQDLKRHVLGKINDYLSIKTWKTTAGIKNKEFISSLDGNSGLQNEILDLINKTDKSISLQHLAKHLSQKYFDGNYHPILNELEQLERNGEIEGQVINGKVFFKKKPKTERKYILRKGRNFRKYIG